MPVACRKTGRPAVELLRGLGDYVYNAVYCVRPVERGGRAFHYLYSVYLADADRDLLPGSEAIKFLQDRLPVKEHQQPVAGGLVEAAYRDIPLTRARLHYVHSRHQPERVPEGRSAGNLQFPGGYHAHGSRGFALRTGAQGGGEEFGFLAEKSEIVVILRRRRHSEAQDEQSRNCQVFYNTPLHYPIADYITFSDLNRVQERSIS